jgi:ketosteroid isomerase-like protein
MGMPRNQLLSIVAILCLAVPTLLGAENAEKAILDAQQRWLECYNHHNVAGIAESEADDFRVTFGDGRVQTKAEQLTSVNRPMPAGAEYRITVETSEVRVYGTAAVVTGIVVEEGKYPNEQGVMAPFHQRSRYTDTWVLQKGHWRVVASHVSELK